MRNEKKPLGLLFVILVLVGVLGLCLPYGKQSGGCWFDKTRTIFLLRKEIMLGVASKKKTSFLFVQLLQHANLRFVP